MGVFKDNFMAGLGSGLASGGMNLITGLISGAMEDKRAAQQHEREKELMSIQNDYQLQQWNRENRYNDPAAVAARFRAAGINPRAVLDNAGSGAGIAGGFSSAPSGGASAPLPYSHLSGLSASVLAGARLGAQNKKDEAEARLATEKAESELFERKYIMPAEQSLKDALAKTQKSEAEIKRIESQWRSYVLTLKTLADEANIDKINEETKYFKTRISLGEAEKAHIYKQIDDLTERISLYSLERQYKRALIAVESNRANNVAMDTALKQAEKGHKEALIKQVDKEIELIGSKMKMNEAQIETWRKKVNIEIAKLSVDSALATSSEIRKWVYGWIPFTNNSSTTTTVNSSDYWDGPSFAD